ncbi:MAG: prolipoprotein diacylglyceryl transferase [Oscillospiraceae bacterium]|nr:prolipoprotein diacylglyceryl transferase [Oscillospiraceae bacterium]
MFPGFEIFGHFIGMYGICAIVGIFAACPIAIVYYKKFTGDDVSMINILLFSAIGVFLGMHLLYGITNIPYWHILFEAEGFVDFWKRFANVFGGSVFYGGLIGGLVAGGITIKAFKLPAQIATDCVAPSIALMHGIMRVGCFLGGCCYGVEWEHGITFTNSLVESANGVPRVPVQLFEAGFEVALFFLLWILLAKTDRLKGMLLALYLLIYSVGRFILEFFRGDEYRGFLFGLSTSQIISVLLFTGSLVFFILKLKKQKNIPKKA